MVQLCLTESKLDAKPSASGRGSQTSHTLRAADVIVAQISNRLKQMSFFLCVWQQLSIKMAAPVKASSEVHLLIFFFHRLRLTIAVTSVMICPHLLLKAEADSSPPHPSSTGTPHPPTSARSSYIPAQTSRRLLARPAVSLPAYQNKTTCSSGLVFSCYL